MSDSEETFPPDYLTMSSNVLPERQIDSEVNIKEELPSDDKIKTDVQEFGTNTLRKITFPISPFKKKLKARTGNLLSNGQISSTKSQNGFDDVSVHEKVLLKDHLQVNESKESVFDCPAVRSPIDLSLNDVEVMATVNSVEEERISYMNLLDLNRPRKTGLMDHRLNRYKTENHKFNAYEDPIGCEVMINENVTEDYFNSNATMKNKTVSPNFSGEDGERTLRTDLLNVTILDKKKQLVDRIKMSITEKNKLSKENIDLSIVKEEMQDDKLESSDSDVEADPPVEPIEQVNVKMESPLSNFEFEDNLSNVMPTIGHFMALPALRQNHKPKTTLADNEGMVVENECVVAHKLVCLICKKTETVSAKKSSIQGNIFLCKTCGKLFDKGGDVNESLLATTSILDVTCIRCNLTFTNAMEVELHNKEVHKGESMTDKAISNAGFLKRHVKPQFCSDCNQTFSETDEVCMHIKSRRHKCEYCHKLFSTNSDLKKHVNIHTNEKTYVCIYCTKAFNSRGNMVKHLETHKERKRSFKCEFCSKTFLKSDHLKVHVNTHTNEKLYECPYCKKTFNRKYCLQLHVNIHTLEKIYECHFCNKVCMDPSTLRKHIGTHSDQRPFKCEFCDKTFKQKPHLTAHMKMHDIKQTFSCSYCDKVFFSKNTLRVHINTHTHEKTFLCVYCQKTFTSKSNLLTHINNKHTVDKTYNCSYCGKVFTDPSTVKKHENIHTNELTYQCAYCDKVFLRKTHLRSHINMHIKYKPYKCKLCDKSFAIKGYLKVHNNIHKGIKPFKCKRCSKAFTSKSNLILHTNSHTKEHMFQCSYCRKSFTQKANLKSHILRSHMETLATPV